ncbi:hypothetical protein IG631_01017 [Alternaria alternata]|nr:hypothetical protein IG631_01017 [Alternaria alternata]
MQGACGCSTSLGAVTSFTARSPSLRVSDMKNADQVAEAYPVTVAFLPVFRAKEGKVHCLGRTNLYSYPHVIPNALHSDNRGAMIRHGDELKLIRANEHASYSAGWQARRLPKHIRPKRVKFSTPHVLLARLLPVADTTSKTHVFFIMP